MKIFIQLLIIFVVISFLSFLMSRILSVDWYSLSTPYVLFMSILLFLLILYISYTAYSAFKNKEKLQFGKFIGIIIFSLVILFSLYTYDLYLSKQENQGLIKTEDSPKGNSSSGNKNGSNQNSDNNQEQTDNQQSNSAGLVQLDFGQYVSLEDEIRLSNEIIMYADLPELKYIRRFVLSGYNSNFYFFKEANKFENDIPNLSDNHYWECPIKKDYKSRLEFNQRYYIVKFSYNAVFSVNDPYKIIPLENINPQRFITNYKVHSMSLFENKGMLSKIKDFGNMQRDMYSYYTKGTSDKRVVDLANKITKNKINVYDKVISIQNYLSKNYKYSLKPGGKDKTDKLMYFLFENKQGYCTYFAFSLVLLCRSIGIPSRVAVGFLPSKNREWYNKYLIMGMDAHAWCEVYFLDYGWVTFDVPTFSPSEELKSENQNELLNKLIENDLNTLLRSKEVEKIIDKDEVVKPVEIINYKIRFLIIAVILTILFILLFIKLLIPTLCKLSKSRIKVIQKSTIYLIGYLQDLGISKIKGETLSEFAIRLKNESYLDLDKIVSLYLVSKYKEIISNEELKMFLNELKFIRNLAWKKASIKNKLLSLIGLKTISIFLQH